MSKGKPLIDRERCKGCTLCIEACPQKILKMSQQINRRGVYYPECLDEGKCTACTFCAIICPDIAIEIEKF
ncbi:MAG: ferredoxin family protein [Spirochaetaceae bacterium]|nr:ferredoxin family protein [Spirochaetaceae bacterium]